ncbi:hypothetical protein TRVA0_039S00584 [Trichomonascus vanleenenianus]|uniref:adaptin-ear-binding coat-associated family protein n=1 Tax=Trichomonascus vanleenenianus TaxID=2268995 RepID=UPI003ECAC844
MSEGDLETTSYITPEVFIYQIPPLRTTQGHTAAEWDADNPIWKGRLKVVEVQSSKGINCLLRLEDSQTGELFATAPYEDGRGVEPVRDSSRFFAITVADGSRKAVLGMGFPDRNAAFEFNIALQDFRRHSSASSSTVDLPGSGKDYSLHEKINLSIGSADSSKSSVELEEPASIPKLAPPPAKKEQRDDPFDDDFGDFVG